MVELQPFEGLDQTACWGASIWLIVRRQYGQD